MIAAIAVPTLVVFIERRVGLEVGARQVLEQHLERGIE
jgi:hypothetical protein